MLHQAAFPRKGKVSGASIGYGLKATATKETTDLQILPSRERSHNPTKREKENHLQTCLYREYVGSQEGM